MAEETQAPQAEGAGAAQKTKKINRLTANDLKKKIEALESAGQVKSVYYKHLIQRRKEMEKPAV